MCNLICKPILHCAQTTSNIPEGLKSEYDSIQPLWGRLIAPYKHEDLATTKLYTFSVESKEIENNCFIYMPAHRYGIYLRDVTKFRNE